MRNVGAVGVAYSRWSCARASASAAAESIEAFCAVLCCAILCHSVLFCAPCPLICSPLPYPHTLPNLGATIVCSPQRLHRTYSFTGSLLSQLSGVDRTWPPIRALEAMTVTFTTDANEEVCYNLPQGTYKFLVFNFS